MLSTQLTAFGAANLIDNDINTFAHTLDNNGDYIEVDLRTERLVSKVLVTNRNNTGTWYRIVGATLQFMDNYRNILYTYIFPSAGFYYSIILPPLVTPNLNSGDIVISRNPNIIDTNIGYIINNTNTNLTSNRVRYFRITRDALPTGYDRFINLAEITIYDDNNNKIQLLMVLQI